MARRAAGGTQSVSRTGGCLTSVPSSDSSSTSDSYVTTFWTRGVLRWIPAPYHVMMKLTVFCHASVARWIDPMILGS